MGKGAGSMGRNLYQGAWRQKPTSIVEQNASLIVEHAASFIVEQTARSNLRANGEC
jgi:hypothetical protein